MFLNSFRWLLCSNRQQVTLRWPGLCGEVATEKAPSEASKFINKWEMGYNSGDTEWAELHKEPNDSLDGIVKPPSSQA